MQLRARSAVRGGRFSPRPDPARRDDARARRPGHAATVARHAAPGRHAGAVRDRPDRAGRHRPLHGGRRDRRDREAAGAAALGRPGPQAVGAAPAAGLISGSPWHAWRWLDMMTELRGARRPPIPHQARNNMKTKAAIAWKAGQPLTIEEVELEGPKEGEVLVEIKATGICHTDYY